MGNHMIDEVVERVHIEDAEHKVSYPQITELFQFVNDLIGIPGNKMFIGVTFHFCGIIRNTDCSQIG